MKDKRAQQYYKIKHHFTAKVFRSILETTKSLTEVSYTISDTVKKAYISGKSLWINSKTAPTREVYISFKI
jgi:hypothetical protein